ncbi:Ion channel [Actinomyces johnsonii F0542]|uniref:Ion channel n=1 Tax=Actinomyces johnsonii F0542 TaxID=1321818 RepID=U1Q5V3_9ACTO|nr:potassium channel family protein [Actinomyces johnsonii]ERH23265.1 Ion channel [Actinomyces johnsonii F0542]
MPTEDSPGTRLRAWERATEWPLTGAAVVFLGAYAWEVLANAQGGAKNAAELVINAVWALFGVDYLVRLALAPSRGQWFLHHLPDLAVIALPILRPLRLLRLVTLVGIMQRSAGTALRGRITLYTAGSAALLIFTSALATLDAERDEPGSSIRTFGQALWWALTTITTIGYGDTFPVSTEGRFIAALLMIGGVALIGVVTATLASWIVSLVEEESAEQEAATQAQVAALQRQVSELSERIDRLLAERESGH